MSSPYPPSAPRKLYRSRSKRMIGGVCGGLADYLNMDPTLVRILTVVIALFTGIPVVLYIVALFVVPEEPTGFPPQAYPPVNAPQGYDTPYAAPAPGAPFGGALRAASGAARGRGLGHGGRTVGAARGQHGARPGTVTSTRTVARTGPDPTRGAHPARRARTPAQAAAPAEPEPSPQPDPVTPAHEADAEESFDEPDHPVASGEDQPKS